MICTFYIIHIMNLYINTYIIQYINELITYPVSKLCNKYDLTIVYILYNLKMISLSYCITKFNLSLEIY